MFNNDLQYKVFKDYEIPFDEKNNSFGAVRKVQWYKAGEEPDESKAKIEIRKFFNKNGEETYGRGYSFSTEEGPSELVHGLISAGFGKTKEILKGIRYRDDFEESVRTIDIDEDEANDGSMYDMRDLLLNIGGSEYNTEDDEDTDEDEE